MAKRDGVRVVVVAMPQPIVYALDPQIKTVVESAGMTFLDCRVVNGISSASFVDEMHLGNDAQRVIHKFIIRKECFVILHQRPVISY